MGGKLGLWNVWCPCEFVGERDLLFLDRKLFVNRSLSLRSGCITVLSGSDSSCWVVFSCLDPLSRGKGVAGTLGSVEFP